MIVFSVQAVGLHMYMFTHLLVMMNYYLVNDSAFIGGVCFCWERWSPLHTVYTTTPVLILCLSIVSLACSTLIGKLDSNYQN